ncbi:MAG: hypothetical protein ACRYFS_13820 [Janthinobacterium lividum]
MGIAIARYNFPSGTMIYSGIVMETVISDRAPTTDAEYEAIVDYNLGQLKIMQGKMDEDQREIEMMRTETDAILADIMCLLKAA